MVLGDIGGLATVLGVLLKVAEEPADGVLVVVVLLAFHDDLYSKV